MLRSLTAEEFLGWKAFAELEPFGDLRADYHAALISQTVANAAGNKKELKDFLLKFEGTPRRPQSWQEQKMIGMAMAAAFSGK